MKKVLSVFLLCALLLCLIGCNDAGSSQSGRETDAPTARQISPSDAVPSQNGRGTDDLLLGHQWGETRNQTKARGVEPSLVLGFKTDLPSYWHNKGLYHIHYHFTSQNYSEIVDALTETLGPAAEISDDRMKYDWYIGSVHYEFDVEYARQLKIENDLYQY